MAQLLRLNQIPLAYIPPEQYQTLRDLVRYRTQLSRQLTQVKIQLRQLLARENIQPPYKSPCGDLLEQITARHREHRAIAA